MDVLGIIIAALFAQNFVLVKFMGICPFLGVSKKPSAALGMGLAVTAVMVITCLVTYPIYVFVLLPLKLEYLENMRCFTRWQSSPGRETWRRDVRNSPTR